MEVKQTTNYDLFNNMDSNREVVQSHVNKLVESIAEKNLLATAPIVVDKYYNVIDGQHRLEAAKKLGVPIFYTIMDGSPSIKDVIRLNNNTRPWVSKDYLHSFIEQGNEHYERLADFMEDFELSVSVAMVLLSKQSRAHKTMMYIFKTGQFKTTPLALAKGEEIASWVVKTKQFSHYTKINRNKNLVYALVNLWYNEDVSFEKLFRKLDVSGIKIPYYSSVQEYLRFFEEVYNWKSRGGNTVRLY